MNDQTFFIIHGPPASGKTINAQALKEMFQCDHVFDAGFDNDRIAAAKGRILILSCDRRVFVKGMGKRGNITAQAVVVMSVQKAARGLGDRWIKPVERFLIRDLPKTVHTDCIAEGIKRLVAAKKRARK